MIKSITIKDAAIPELINVFGKEWQAEIQDPAEDLGVMMPNPVTKSTFANAEFDKDIRTYIHRRVSMFRQNAAVQAADTTEITE